MSTGNGLEGDREGGHRHAEMGSTALPPFWNIIKDFKSLTAT
jgi:hypothetical protein